MVALSLFAMCGLLGLAVDVGWSFFIKKSAQAAADSAALAGAAAAYAIDPSASSCPGGANKLNCTTGATHCNTITSANGNLYNACQYAAQNGFTDGANGYTVTVDADRTASRAAPTVSGVATSVYAYWVTVRASQDIPQLFSAVWGNRTGTAAARATGAIALEVFNFSLDMLNRQNDPTDNPGDKGVNLTAQSGTITAPAGILMASNKIGAANMANPATIVEPFTYFRDTGTCAGYTGQSSPTNPICGSQWSPGKPANGKADGPYFEDPTAGKYQPPVNVSTDPVHDCQVKGGILTPANIVNLTNCPVTTDPKTGNYLLPSGNYYAVNAAGTVATGYQFTTSSGFGQWVIYGGITFTGGVGNTVNFASGEYVFAGTQSKADAITLANKSVMQDSGTGGELFLFTNPNYSTPPNGPNLASSLAVPTLVQAIQSTLGYGNWNTTGGVNTSVSLQGLNTANLPSGIATKLHDYNNFVAWQDRGNSTVQYTADGHIITDFCGTPGNVTVGPGSIDNPCANIANVNPGMSFATPGTGGVKGVLYQPRGSWLNLKNLQAGATLQIIAGAIYLLPGAGNLTLTSPATPFTVNTVALIE
jgi:hypothetical protein